MKILIDMNLPPAWVEVLEEQGWQAVHWSSIGEPHAEDSVIMEWASGNGYIVFTHDLDFGAILASTRAQGPSVIQVRTQDVLPHKLASMLLPILIQYESTLSDGALITVEESKSRVRILPF